MCAELKSHEHPGRGDYQYRPKFQLLDRQGCLRLHTASLQILKTTGIEVFHDKALALLKQGGANISGINRAILPPSLVEWALASVPGPFNLYRRGTDEIAIRLDGSHVYFGPGSDTLHYLDPRSGSRRDYTLDDIGDCMRIVDALPQLGFAMSVGVPRDVPGNTYYRFQYARMINNTTKPIVFVCDNLADIKAIHAMASAVAGGETRLARYPTLLLYSEPSTPLQHSDTATDKLLYCAEHQIPITHSPAPMMGGTAPVTLAGAVVLGNAEVLSSLVMHQLKNPGAPFLYGHGVHHMDMKTMISVYGAPEYQLARVMAAEMGRFYGLPVWGYAAHSDSNVLDGQAAIDAQFSVQVALMARTNLNHDVGYLEAGLMSSPEMMVLTDELISMNRHFMRGVDLGNEYMGLEVIDQVGPGGEFLSQAHTLEHWRELWQPQLFNRQRYEAWESSGGKTIWQRVKERTLTILDRHQIEPLEILIQNEIENILLAG